MIENDDSLAQKSDKNTTDPGGATGHSRTSPDQFDRLGLSSIQLRAIELSVEGFSNVQIAKELDITPKTLWRWKSFNENFRQVLDETRSQRYAAATDRYQSLLISSTSVLARFLGGEDKQDQFRAAALLLNMAGCFKPTANKKEKENALAKRLDPFDLKTLMTPNERLG
jgi:hypothetical protein